MLANYSCHGHSPPHFNHKDWIYTLVSTCIHALLVFMDGVSVFVEIELRANHAMSLALL